VQLARRKLDASLDLAYNLDVVVGQGRLEGDF
jgi:hypothetical protein